MLHARLDDPGERHRLVGQAWDVGKLDARYQTFIGQWADANAGPNGQTNELVDVLRPAMSIAATNW